MVSLLREEFPGLNDSDALAELASRATDLSSEDASDIVEVLTTLYILRARHESSIPDFVEDVGRALAEAEGEELKLSGEDFDRFKDRLTELLGVELFGIESKALDVQFENERTFRSARIVTEIRPIFGPDPQDPPTGAVIVHMLRITYGERNRSRDFFVALDAEDASTLGKLLDRADVKTQSLKSFLALTGLPHINLGGK